MRIIYENNHQPDIGKYKDAIVEDYASDLTYLYDACGTYVTLPHDARLSHPFTAEDSISIEHNLGKYPAVTVMDETGAEIMGEVTHADVNNVLITFSEPISGIISLN